MQRLRRLPPESGAHAPRFYLYPEVARESLKIVKVILVIHWYSIFTLIAPHVTFMTFKNERLHYTMYYFYATYFKILVCESVEALYCTVQFKTCTVQTKNPVFQLRFDAF
jgi:hypothetical protein